MRRCSARASDARSAGGARRALALALPAGRPGFFGDDGEAVNTVRALGGAVGNPGAEASLGVADEAALAMLAWSAFLSCAVSFFFRFIALWTFWREGNGREVK
jgi:hypothetical protein